MTSGELSSVYPRLEPAGSRGIEISKKNDLQKGPVKMTCKKDMLSVKLIQRMKLAVFTLLY